MIQEHLIETVREQGARQKQAEIDKLRASSGVRVSSRKRKSPMLLAKAMTGASHQGITPGRKQEVTSMYHIVLSVHTRSRLV